MELVGRFPTAEEARKLKLSKTAPTWLPSDMSTLENIMTAEVVAYIGKIRKFVLNVHSRDRNIFAKGRFKRMEFSTFPLPPPSHTHRHRHNFVKLPFF